MNTKRLSFWAAAAGTVMALTAMPASAVVTLTLSTTPDPLSYQVSEQTPCIIGDQTNAGDPTKGGCSPPKNNITGGDLPATALYTASGGTFTVFENHVPATIDNTTLQYTVSQFAAFPIFNVALDMNSNAQTEAETDKLFYFRVYIDGTLVYEFDSPNGTVISSINNGTGYSDYLLSTIDLSSYTGTAKVVFDAKWQSGDGNDYFFIVPSDCRPGDPGCGQSVPEPDTLALLGIGLLGLGMRRLRKARG